MSEHEEIVPLPVRSTGTSGSPSYAKGKAMVPNYVAAIDDKQTFVDTPETHRKRYTARSTELLGLLQTLDLGLHAIPEHRSRTQSEPRSVSRMTASSSGSPPAISISALLARKRNVNDFDRMSVPGSIPPTPSSMMSDTMSVDGSLGQDVLRDYSAEAKTQLLETYIDPRRRHELSSLQVAAARLLARRLMKHRSLEAPRRLKVASSD